MTEMRPGELTLQDFGQLPLRALVGLAARCARRTLPVLNGSPDSPGKIHALKNATAALQLAEDFARDGIIWLQAFNTLGQQAYEAAHDNLGEGQYVAWAAGHAATAAALANRLLERPSMDDAMELVAAAWGAYRVLLSFVRGPIRHDPLTGDMVVGVLRAEYARLLELDLGRFGQAGKALETSDEGPLGPLWPEGPPCWYE
jgi:hypothetical protein